ncbi:MAG: AgmX/PglI C-terminal domain-containing protein [Myxococcales bacterium]|nr:AgmX/PglI C-terminal domain-containing protein [Myxococcales bacterium]
MRTYTRTATTIALSVALGAVLAACGSASSSQPETRIGPRPGAVTWAQSDSQPVPECSWHVPRSLEVEHITMSDQETDEGEGGVGPSSVSSTDIEVVIRRRLPAIRECFSEAVSSDPTLFGELVAVWEFEPSGVPVCASVETSYDRLSPMTSCVRDAVSSVRFGREIGQSMRVTYPIRISSAPLETARR